VLNEKLINRASDLAEKLRLYGDRELGVPIADDGATMIDELCNELLKVNYEHEQQVRKLKMCVKVAIGE
jgi:hypothetical protein